MVAKSSSKFKFKLIEKKNLWFLISFVFITAGGFKIVSQAFKSEPILNYGIDFVGGTSMMIRFNELDAKINDNIQNKKNYHANFIEKIRMSLIQFGLTKSYIQITQENEVIIKTTQFNTEEEGINRSERLTVHLEEALGKLEILEIDSIGPTIGQELRSKSLWIIITVSILLLLYITWRFEFNFGVSALIAVLHDALITISLSALLNIEINTAFVAAILTILGYSINDTIVIFDRIRENLPLRKKGFLLKEIANISINQTLVRSINTSITTLLVISCLLILGGNTISSFCLVLLIGVITGTYSSICIASPSLVLLSKSETEDKQ